MTSTTKYRGYEISSRPSTHRILIGRPQSDASVYRSRNRAGADRPMPSAQVRPSISEGRSPDAYVTICRRLGVPWFETVHLYRWLILARMSNTLRITGIKR